MNWLTSLLFRTLNEKLDKIILSQAKQGEQLDEILRNQQRENLYVTPELAQAVRLVSAIAVVIDKKVPDTNVPPAQPQH